MSSDYPLTPPGDLDDRRVMKPSSADFASVEYILSKTCIAEAWKNHLHANAMVQDSPSVDRMDYPYAPASQGPVGETGQGHGIDPAGYRDGQLAIVRQQSGQPVHLAG